MTLIRYIVVLIIFTGYNHIFFAQIGVDSNLLKDQNPNYQKSKNKYVKTTITTNSLQTAPVIITTPKTQDTATQKTSTETHENGLSFYKTKIKEAEEKNDQLGLASALLNIANFYSKNNILNLAIENYQKALKQYQLLNNNKGILEALNNIGVVYSKQNNYTKAEECYLNTLTLAKKINNSEKIKSVSNALSKLYAKQGNYKNAYEMHFLFKQMTDSLYQLDIQQKQIREQFAQKRLLDSLQEVQNKKNYQEKIETKQNEIESAKKITYLISAGLLLALLLAFSFYRGFKNTKKSNQIISLQKQETEEKKQIIEKALEEKELLLKEIHHRVKNNLQIISSLLNLQSNRTEDEDLKKIMTEAKNRIGSMALIHQKIYQSGNLTSIDFQGYIEQMIQTIESTFNNKKINITYYINTNAIKLDMDTAVPLGLIINELLTNCYKYAFVNQTEGCVNVILERKNTNELELHVSDNGIGIPENMDITISKSLGLKLVKGLAGQLKGTLRCENNQGAHFFITFKNTALNS